MHVLDHTETGARTPAQARTFKITSPHMKGDDIVAFQKAGQHICRAGFANAPHFHFMVNSEASRFWSGDRPRGLGDRDPWPIVKYAIDHS